LPLCVQLSLSPDRVCLAMIPLSDLLQELALGTLNPHAEFEAVSKEKSVRTFIEKIGPINSNVGIARFSYKTLQNHDIKTDEPI